jgi:hypothetical protein
LDPATIFLGGQAGRAAAWCQLDKIYFRKEYIMAETKEQKTAMKAKFRATLALLFSIIALIIAAIALNRTGTQEEFNAEILELRQKLEKTTRDTAEKMKQYGQETSQALRDLKIEIKKSEEKPIEPETQ